MTTTTIQTGARIEYRLRGRERSGTVLGSDPNMPFSIIVYLVRVDCSGRVELVQPHQIITR